MSPKVSGGNQTWVWVEHHRQEIAQVSLSLIGKAQELCRQMGDGEVITLLAGKDSQQLADELINYGADKVFLADNPDFNILDTEPCARFISELIKNNQPEIFLWGATSTGREIASRVAAKLETGLTAHCIDLYIEEINNKAELVAVVAGWGGNVTIKIICPEKRPQMATVKPGIFPPPKPVKRKGEVIPIRFEDGASRLDIIEVDEAKEMAASMEEATIVVAGGWGLSSLGGFQSVEELAKVLEGNVGGTRPALDAGWISKEQMIGQSGKTIAPQLLITLGISGAAQFATAILSSRFILAVDINPKAPIFEMADAGIVGDVRDILPLLIARIKEIKKVT